MSHPVWRAIVAGLVAAAIVSADAVVADQSPKLSRNDLVTAAAAYVRAYQQEFAFLIADEHTVQESFGVKEKLRVPLATRTARGEIFLTFLEGRRHWTIVRDVAEVDGVPIVDREDLRSLLSREDADAVARRLFALNARYNIGNVVRNFNDPMLALLPLSDAHRSRFGFDVENTRREDGVVLATLAFRERERPTLVRLNYGTAALSRGAITVDAATGTVRHTRFTVRHKELDAELVTEFALEERLNLWVPSKFSELYTSSDDDTKDEIRVTSAYSNYRRFEARGRLLTTRPAEP